jgi:hypothetical protein
MKKIKTINTFMGIDFVTEVFDMTEGKVQVTNIKTPLQSRNKSLKTSKFSYSKSIK